MRFPSPEYRDLELPPRPLAAPRRDRRWKHAALLLLTVITTTTIGGCHYASFTDRRLTERREASFGSRCYAGPERRRTKDRRSRDR